MDKKDKEERQFAQIHCGIYDLPIPAGLLDSLPNSRKWKAETELLRCMAIVLYGCIKQKASNTTNIGKITKEQMSQVLFMKSHVQSRRKLAIVIKVLKYWGMKELPDFFTYIGPKGANTGYGYDLTGILDKIRWKSAAETLSEEPIREETEEQVFTRLFGYLDKLPQKIRNENIALIKKAENLDMCAVERIRRIYEDWLKQKPDLKIVQDAIV